MIAVSSLLTTLLLFVSASMGAPASEPRRPRQSSTVSVSTAIGTAEGVSDSSGANRFAVRYASAERWAESYLATTWAFPYVILLGLLLKMLTLIPATTLPMLRPYRWLALNKAWMIRNSQRTACRC